jgi:hypothetical protein
MIISGEYIDTDCSNVIGEPPILFIDENDGCKADGFLDCELYDSIYIFIIL